MHDDLTWVVPHRETGDLHRARCWQWVKARGRKLYACQLIEGDRRGSEVFSHAGGFNEGVDRATTELVLLTDTDTTVDRQTFDTAYQAVRSGRQRWAMAAHYVKINERATRRLLVDAPFTNVNVGSMVKLERDTEWVGRSWAGFLLMRRDDYLTIGGYDERIPAWGADDTLMAVQLTSLLGDEPRVAGHVWHLWHDNAYEREHGMTDDQWSLVRAHEGATSPELLAHAMTGKPGYEGAPQ